MARTHYQEGFGVSLLRWRVGEPQGDLGVIIVEVWAPELRLRNIATKPGIAVHASVEVRVKVDGIWKRLIWNGAIVDVSAGQVRRWAPMPMDRWWHATIALDGWT